MNWEQLAAKIAAMPPDDRNAPVLVEIPDQGNCAVISLMNKNDWVLEIEPVIAEGGK